jgi:hypothetical protein
LLCDTKSDSRQSGSVEVIIFSSETLRLQWIDSLAPLKSKNIQFSFMSSDDNYINNKPASSEEDDDSLRMMAFGGSEKGDETDSVKDMNEMLNTRYHRGGSVSSNDRLEGEDILNHSQSAAAPGTANLTDSKGESSGSNNTPKASNAVRDVEPPLSNDMSQQLSQPHETLIRSEQQNLDGSRARSDSAVIQHPGNDQPTEQIRGRFRIQPPSMAQSPLLLSREPSRSRSPPTRLPVLTAGTSASLMSPHTSATGQQQEMGSNQIVDQAPQIIQPAGQEDGEVNLPVTKRYPLQSSQQVGAVLQQPQHQQPLQVVGTTQLGEVTSSPLIQQQQISGQHSIQTAKRVDTPILSQNAPQAMAQQEFTQQVPIVQQGKHDVPTSNSVVGDGSLAAYPPPSIPPLVHPSQAPIASVSSSVQHTVVGMVGNTPVVAIPETALPQTFSKKKGRFKLLPATTPGTPTRAQQAIERVVPERSVSLGADSQSIPLQTVDRTPIIKKKGRFVVTNVSANAPMQTVMTTAQPILPNDHKLAALQAPTRPVVNTAHTVLLTNPHTEMQAPVPVPVMGQPIFAAEKTITSVPSLPIANSIAQQAFLPVEEQPNSILILPQQPLSSQRTSPVPATSSKHASEPNSPASFQTYGGRPPPAFTSAPPEELLRLKTGTGEKAKVPNQQQRPTKPAPRHIAPGFAGQQQGFGKMYYFLDQMRSEVQEADRTIKSLQTDMRCMVRIFLQDDRLNFASLMFDFGSRKRRIKNSKRKQERWSGNTIRRRLYVKWLKQD